MLEYQPEPMNHWNIVGQLEAKKEHHGVLSIDPELLPCLKGCLSKLTKVYLNISCTQIREGFKKTKWKFLMAFAIKRRTPSPPLMALISIHFFLFFLLQLNLTYMKRILHLVSVKNITFISLIIGSKLTFSGWSDC